VGSSSATSFYPATNSVPGNEIELISLALGSVAAYPGPVHMLALSLASSSSLQGIKIAPYFCFLIYINTEYSGLLLKKHGVSEMRCGGLAAGTGCVVSFGFYVGCLVA